MREDDPLIPRPYIRAAIAAAILLVLIAGTFFVGNYVLSTLQQRQHDIALAAQEAVSKAQLEGAERAAAEHAKWLEETVTVSLVNDSSSNTGLWTATPNGTNTDGSTIWAYNQACVALPGQTCSSQFFDHRGILITGHSGSPYWQQNTTWHWENVPEYDDSLTAHDLPSQ